MKQTLALLVFTAVVLSTKAQVKLEDLIKPGTKLIYAVKTYSSTYDFIVTIKDAGGMSFDWEMTSPADMKGTINHTKKALQNAYKMYNFFHSETRTLDDNTLSVWLSQKSYKALAKGDAVKVCMHNPTDVPVMMKQFMDGEFNVKIDGDGKKIYDKWVKPAKKVKDKWIIDPTNDDAFTYYNSAKCPIILRMHADFELALKEVITK